MCNFYIVLLFFVSFIALWKHLNSRRSYIIFWEFAWGIWNSIKTTASYWRHSFEGFYCAAPRFRYNFLAGKKIIINAKHELSIPNIWLWLVFSLCLGYGIIWLLLYIVFVSIDPFVPEFWFQRLVEIFSLYFLFLLYNSSKVLD